jgi:hypothetical protein
MTNSNFLKINFPVLPYCIFNRGPSTRFNESFHINNSNTGIHLNIYWRDDELVIVSIFSEKETNPWNKNNEVYRGKDFNSLIANNLCNQYLK